MPEAEITETELITMEPSNKQAETTNSVTAPEANPTITIQTNDQITPTENTSIRNQQLKIF